MKQPTAREIRKALKAWVPQDKLKFWPNWDTRGRPWQYGLRGSMTHWWAGTGDGGLAWFAGGEGGPYPYANAAIRFDGTVVVLSALSAWHSGQGGPWQSAGAPKDAAHLMVWGNELEGGINAKDDQTAAQWEALAQVNCALREAAGKEAFPNFKRVIAHRSWTDGTDGVADVPFPYTWEGGTRGRKNDVSTSRTVVRTEARKLWRQKQK